MNAQVSRVTTRQSGAESEEAAPNYWGTCYTLAHIKGLQESDPDISPILQWRRESETRPEAETVVIKGPATRNLWLHWNLLEIVDGVLYKKRQTNTRSSA